MDDEDRQKKVLLGKEKLAAFKKKKLKKKKKRRDPEVDLGTESEASSVIDVTELGSLSDVSDSSFSAEGEDDLEEYRLAPQALEKARREQIRSHDRITELEETLLGKQTLLDSLLGENEILKTQLSYTKSGTVKPVPSQSDLSTVAFDRSTSLTMEDCQNKIAECQVAIRQRDDLIGQLSENLRQTEENRDSLQADYQRQAEQLAEQVQILQDQLKQTGDWLQQHSGGHGISAEALLEAKNELLALQQVNKQKDGQIKQLQAAVQERDQTITHIVDKYNGSAANFEKMKKAYIHLQNETMVLKQEKSSTSVGKLQLEVSNLKHSYNDALHQISQLAQVKAKYEFLEVENEKLKSVNDELLKKDSGSTEVLKQLMTDIETLQKGGAQRMTVESSAGKEDFQKEIDRLRAELEESHGQQIVQLKEELQNQHRIELDRANRELSQLRTDKQQLNRQVTEWQKMYMTLSETGASGADLHLELHALRTENSMYKDKISKLDSELSLLLRDKEGLEKELEVVQSSGGASNQDIQTITNQCSRYKKELFELTNEIQSLHSERKTVLKELEDSQKKVHELDVLQGKAKTYESMVVTLEGNLAVAVQERDSYINQLDSLKSKLQSIHGTMDIVSAELENTEKLLESKEHELSQSHRANEQLRELHSQTQRELAQSGVQLNDTSDKLSQSLAQLHSANTRVVELESELKTGKMEMDSLRSNHEHDLKVIQDQFELRLKVEVEESNTELQKTKLEVETLRTTQSASGGEDKSSEVSAAVSAVQEKYQAEIDRLKSEYTQYIQQMQANYEAQIKSAYEQWQTAHETQVKQVQEQYTAAHQEMVVKLQEQYTAVRDAQVTELQQQHQKELQVISEKYDTELMKVKKMADSQVEELRREEIENVAQHGKTDTVETSMELRRVQQRHNEEVQRLQSEHSLEIGRLKAHCDRLAAQVVAENPSSSGESYGEVNSHCLYHTETKTTRVVHRQVIQSSHTVEDRSVVGEMEPGTNASTSTSASMSVENHLDNQSVQSLPHETIDMISTGDLTGTAVSDQSIPLTEHSDLTDLITALRGKVEELEDRNSALEEINQKLSEEVVASQKDSSLDAMESSSGSSTTLHEVQLKDYQLSLLEKENDKLTARVNHLNALLANQGKQPVESEYIEERESEALAAMAEQIKVEVYSTQDEAIATTDDEHHYTSMTSVPEAEVSVMTESSDLYVSALESPAKGELVAAASAPRVEDLQVVIRDLKSSKHKLASELRAAEHSAIENEGKLLNVIEGLKDRNVELSKEISKGEREEVSSLRNRLTAVQTSKASLETEIFYKDLEISKLMTEKESLLEKESKTKQRVAENGSETKLSDMEKDEVDAQEEVSDKAVGSMGTTETSDDQTDDEDVTTQLKVEIETLKADLQLKEEDLDTYKMQLDAQQADFDRLKMEMVGENFEVERLNAEVGTLKERPDNTSTSETEAESRAEFQKVTVEELKEQVKKLEQEKEELVGTLDEREIDIGELKAELDSQNTEIMELMKEAMEVDEEKVKQALTDIHKEASPGPATVQVQDSPDGKIIEQGPDLAKSAVEGIVEKTSEEVLDLQWKLDKISADKAELEKRLEEAVEEVLTLKEEVENLRSEYDGLKVDLEKATSDLVQKEQLFQNQAENVEVCVADLNEKISKLEECEKELEEKLKSSQEELTAEREQYSLLRTKDVEIEQKCAEFEKEIWQYKDELQKVKEENDKILSQKSDLENNITEVKGLLENAVKEQLTSKDELDKQKEGLNQFKLEIEELRKETERLMQEKEQLVSENKECKTEFERVNNDNEMTKIEMVKLVSANSSVEKDLQKLQNEKQEMDTLHAQQVQSLKEDHAKLVANYERLLESVTSEKGDIVSEFEQMREMVDEKQKLVHEMQEETALLRLANQELLQEQQQEGDRLVREMDDLERGKAEVSEQLQSLQGDYEDMRCRVEEIKGQEEKVGEIEKEKERLLVENESLQRMVTGQGETIVGLKEEVKVHKGQVEVLTARCEELKAEIQGVEGRIVEVESAEQISVVKIKESEERLEMTRQQLAQEKCALETVQCKLVEKEKNLKEKEYIVGSLQMKMKEMHEEYDRLKIDIEKSSAASKSDLSLLEEKLVSSDQSIELLKVEIGMLQSEKKDSDRRLGEIDKERQNLEINLENLWSEKEQLNSSMNLLKEEKDAISANVNSSREEISGLKAVNQDLEANIEQLKSKLNNMCHEKQTLAESLENSNVKFNEESDALKAQLIEAQNANMTSRSDISLLNEKLDGSTQSIELLKVQIGNLQNEKGDREHNVKELRDKVEDLQSHCEALKTQNEDLKTKATELKEENEILSASVKTSSQEMDLLRSATSSMEETTEMLRTEIQGLTDQKQDLQNSLDMKIKELHEENDVIKREIVEATKLNAASKSDVSLLEQKLGESVQSIEELQVELGRLRNEKETRQHELTELTTERQTLETNCVHLKAQNEDLMANVRVLKEENEKTTLLVKTSGEEITVLQKHNHELKERIEVLVSEVKEAISDKESTRSSLELVTLEKQDLLKKVKASTSTLAETEKSKQDLLAELECVKTQNTALAAHSNAEVQKLSEDLGNLQKTVSQMETMKLSLTASEEGLKQRLEAVTLEAVEERVRLERETEDAKASMAQASAKAKEELEEMAEMKTKLQESVEHLNHEKEMLTEKFDIDEEKMNSVIAELRSEILGLRSNIEEINRASSVQLEQLAQSNDKVSGEKDQLEDLVQSLKNERGVLDEKLSGVTSEKTELAQKVDQLSETKIQLEQEVSKLRSEIDKVNSDLMVLSESNIKLKEEVTGLNSMIKTLEVNRAELKDAMDSLGSEKEGVCTELSGMRDAHSKLEREMETMTGTVREQRSKLEQNEEDMKKYQGKLLDLNSEVEEWKASLSKSQNVLEDREKAIRVLKGIEGRVTELEERNEQFAVEKRELETSNTELEKRLQNAVSEKDKVHRDIEGLRHQREDLEKQQLKAAGENKILRNLVDQLKQQTGEAENQVERLTSECTLLKDQSQNDVSSLKSEIQGLKSEADLLRAEKLEVESLVDKGETALTGFRAEKERLSNEMKALSVQLKSLESNAQKSKEQLAEVTEELGMSKNNFKKQELEISELLKEKVEAEGKMKQLQDELTVMSNEKTEMCSELSKTMQKFVSLKSDLEGLSSKLSKKSEQVNELNKGKASVEEELSQTKESVKRLRGELEEVVRGKTESGVTIEGLKSEIEGLRGELTQERMEKRESEEKVRKELEKLQGEKGMIMVRTEEMERDLGKLQSEKGEFVVRIEDLVKELESYRCMLEDEQKEHSVSKRRIEELKGVEDALSSRVQCIAEEKGELENNKRLIRKEIEVVHSQNKKLHEDFDRLRNEVTMATKAKEFSDKERNEVQDSLDRLLHEHGMVTMEKEESARRSKNLADEVAMLKQSLQAADIERQSSVEHVRLLSSDKEGLSSLTEEYLKESTRLREDLAQAREKTTRVIQEQDRLRSENLSLEVQRDRLEEKCGTIEREKQRLIEKCGAFEAQMKGMREDRVTATETGQASLKQQLEELQKRHSEAMYDLQKQIKNQTNLTDQLEKENRKLQEKNTDVLRESEGVRRGREETHRDYMKMSHEYEVKQKELQDKDRQYLELRTRLDQLEAENSVLRSRSEVTPLVSKQKELQDKDRQYLELRTRLDQLEAENSVLRSRSEVTPSRVAEVGAVADLNAVTAQVVAQHEQEVRGLQDEIIRLQRTVTERSEQTQLMEASIENVKYERDRLKQQVEEFERSIREGEDLDVSIIHEQEVSTLKRSLETVMNEREAMKTTFEEDLARLSTQVEEKENERRQLEDVVEDLKDQSEELLRHSTPLVMSEQDSTSTTDSPPKQPHHALHPPPHFSEGFGAGRVSDSVDDYQMLRNLHEIAPDTMTDRFEAEPEMVEQLESDLDVIDKKEAELEVVEQPMGMQNVGGLFGMGIFSDSCKFDGERNLQLKTGLGDRMKARSRKGQKVLENATDMSAQSKESMEDLIERYERKIAEMKEQFEVELKVTEFNTSETYRLQQYQVRAQVQADLETEYQKKYKELENDFEHKVKLLKKENDSKLVTELQMLKQEFEKSYKDKLETSAESHGSSRPDGETDSQLTEETLMLRRKLERAEEAKIDLMEQVDNQVNREAELQEEVLTLTQEKDRLARENTKLGEHLEFYTQTGTVESTSEFSPQEWRVSYDTQLRNKDPRRIDGPVKSSEDHRATGSSVSSLNDIGDGSLPTSQEVPPSVVSEALQGGGGGLQLDSVDENELRNQLDALISENESLKVKLKNQNLGVDESMREEALEMHSKYQMLLQEKENLLRHLHHLGINPSNLSVKQASAGMGDDMKAIEPELDSSAETQGTMDGDFMDWKLKYEVVEKENQTLKSRLESVDSLQRVDSPGVTSSSAFMSSRHYVITSGEYRNRYSALVEQNEMLRAHLGARGMCVDRSLEGDTLDMHLQLMTLATENEQLQQHLENYDTGHLQGEEMVLQGATAQTVATTTTATIQGHGDNWSVNWRQMYEKLCKEHEDLTVKFDDLQHRTEPTDDKVTTGGADSGLALGDVELELQSAMEESVSDESLTVKDKQQTHSEKEKPSVVVSVASVDRTNLQESSMVKSLEKERATLKSELQTSKSKAKRDLTKIKAKLAASNRELQTVKSKLVDLESHESVGSTLSNTSDSSAPEDGGFVVVSRDKGPVSKSVSETSSAEMVTTGHISETVITESVHEKETFSVVKISGTSLPSNPIELEDRCQKQKAQLTQLESENRTLHQEKEKLKDDLKVLEAEATTLGKQKGDTDSNLTNALECAKSEIEALNEQLFSLQRSAKDKEKLLENKCSLLVSDLQESSQTLDSLTAELSKLKAKSDHEGEWHKAENLNLQDQIELLINDKKNLLTQLKDMEKSSENMQRKLQLKLTESLKEVDQLKHQLELVNVQKSKAAEQLVSLEEQYSESEVIVTSLRLQVERHSVSEKDLQARVKELESEGNSCISEQLLNLEARAPGTTSSVSTSVQTLHGGSYGSSEPFSSDVCPQESDSSVYNQSMDVHGVLVHGVGIPTQGDGMQSDTQPKPQTLLASNESPPLECSDSHVQTPLSFQETDTKTADSETTVKRQVGFQPIRVDENDDVCSEDRRLTYNELLEECKELRHHYENIASQNSQLMLHLEEMESELTDTKFQLSCQEDTSKVSIIRETVQGAGHSVVQAEDQTDELYCDSLEGDNKSDSSFTMSGVVNMSMTDITGSVENDIGRVVDVQTVSPSGLGQMTKSQGDATSSDKKSRSKGFVSSTPKQHSGIKAKEVKKPQGPNVKDIKSGRGTPKTGKLSKAVSEAELSADLLKKERDKFQRENRQLKEKINQMSRASNELSSLRTRYDRLNKEKRDLQTKYEKDISRKSPGVGSMRKKTEADELKKLKVEKSKLDKEIKELKSQNVAKAKENTELLNIIHHSGQIPYNQDITQLRIEYEILLDEKKQMCDQFETEKTALSSEIEDLQSQLELVELERDSAVQVGLSVSNGHGLEGRNEDISLRRHVLELSQKVRELEQDSLNSEEKQKDDRVQTLSHFHSEKMQLQQKVNDLNAKMELLQSKVRDLTSQLRLAELEKAEIKSELEEQPSNLEQENNPNKKQLAVIQATDCVSSHVSTFTTSSSDDQRNATRPVTVQIPPAAAAASHSHLCHSSNSPFSVKSSHSPVSIGSASSMQNHCSLLEGLTFSEIVTQYEILLQEKKTICSKLDNAQEALKELQCREAELVHIEEERESYKIQCELLMDEKEELCARVDSEIDIKTKLRMVTEQMLELKRENQVLKIRTESLRRTLSQEPIEEECFETEEVALQRKHILELEHRVKELVIELEKSEQDLEISEVTAKQQAEETSLKFEAELKDEKAIVSNLTEELDDSKFRLDEMKVLLEMVQEEKDQALAEVKGYTDRLVEIDREIQSLTSENDQLKLAMSDKEKQIADTMNELQEALDDCLTGKKALWTEIQQLKGKLEEKEQTKPETGGDQDKSKEKDRMTDLQEQNNCLQGELSALKQENMQCKEQMGQLMSGVTLLTAENDILTKEKERLEGGLVSLQKHAKDASDQIASINVEYTKLQQDRTLLTTTNESLSSNLSKMEGDLQKLRTQNEELCSVKADLEEELSVSTSSYAKLEGSFEMKNQEFDEALKSSELSIAGWKDKCLRLEKDVESLKQELDETLKKEGLTIQKQEKLVMENGTLKAKVTEIEKVKTDLEQQYYVLESDSQLQKENLEEKVTELRKEIEKDHEDFHHLELVNEQLSHCNTELKLNKVNKETCVDELRMELGTVNKKLVDTKAKEDHLQAELEASYAASKCLTEEGRKLNAEKQLLDSERAELKLKNNALKSEIESMNTELHLWKEKVEASQSQLEMEIKVVTSTHESKLESLSEEKNNEIKKLKDENEDIRHEIKEISSRLEVLVKEKAEMETGLKMSKGSLNQVKESLVTSKLSVNEMRTELSVVKKDTGWVRLEKEALQKLLTEAETRNIELVDENISLTAKLEQLKLDYLNNLEELRNHIKEMEVDKGVKEEEIRRLVHLFNKEETKESVAPVNSSTPKINPPACSSDELDLSVVTLNNNVHCKDCEKFQIKCEELYKEIGKLNELCNRGSFMSEDTVGDTDVGTDLNISELQEENACLFRQKTELENALMTANADKQDIEGKLSSAQEKSRKEVETLKHNVGDYQSLCDTVSKAKERLEQELLRQREEYEASLSMLRSEKLEQFIEDAGRLEDFVEEMRTSERKVAELRDELRTVDEEKGLLQLKVGHLLRECKLYERHIKDLEREVHLQACQIQEATQEHKETIRMLAEMRLEQEMSKQQQKGEFSRIDGEIKRLETEMHSNLSTPRAMSVVSAPVQGGKARAGSVLSCDEEGKVWSDFGGELEGERALSLKHFQMIEEINRLHRDLQEARDANNTMNFENKRLKEALDFEKVRQQSASKDDDDSLLVTDSFVEMHHHSSRGTVDTPKSGSRRSSICSVDYNDIPAEMISLKEKSLLLQTTNHKLTKENDTLRSHISKLEKLVEEYQVRVKRGKSGDLDKVLTQQITLLKQQRDDLLRKVDELKECSVQYIETKDEKSKLEESLRRERDLVRQRTHEKEKVEIELLRERLALERQIRDQHRLEDLIKNKEVLEKELYRQKQTLEDELQTGKADSKGKNLTTSAVGQDSSRLVGDMDLTVAASNDISGKTTETSLATYVNTTTVSGSASRSEVGQPTNSSGYGDRLSTSSLSYSSRRHSSQSRSRYVGSSSSRSGASPRGGSQRKLTLECGCVADLDTMKMYVECHYHTVVERLRKDLKRVEGQFKAKRK